VARELGVPQREALDDVPLAVSGRAGSQCSLLAAAAAAGAPARSASGAATMGRA
jgi:hypothetical protein